MYWLEEEEEDKKGSNRIKGVQRWSMTGTVAI